MRDGVRGEGIGVCHRASHSGFLVCYPRFPACWLRFPACWHRFCGVSCYFSLIAIETIFNCNWNILYLQLKVSSIAIEEKLLPIGEKDDLTPKKPSAAKTKQRLPFVTETIRPPCLRQTRLVPYPFGLRHFPGNRHTSEGASSPPFAAAEEKNEPFFSLLPKTMYICTLNYYFLTNKS